MTNPKASEQMKLHWGRCEKIGELVGISKAEANQHWSCCLKKAWEAGADGNPWEAALKRAYAECLLGTARHERDLADWRARTMRGGAAADKRRAGPPTLDGRIKIMLWAIKTCGGVELAEDALERAKRSLEGKGNG